MTSRPGTPEEPVPGLRFPRPLPASPTIGIWTPSSPAAARFPKRFERALRAMGDDGMSVRLAEHARHDDGLFAGSPEETAEDLHRLLADPEVDAVVCVAGGYVTSRVLDHVDFDLVRSAAKPLVGYSDVSAMLWATLGRARLSTFHGPMVVSEWGEHGGMLPYTRQRFLDALRPSGGETVLTAPGEWTDEYLHWDRDDTRPRRTRPGRWRELVPGTARGWLLPGCAPSVAGLFGTPYLPDTTGAILCLETTGTSAEEFCGLLTQWRQSGRLDGIAGLIIGRHGQVPAGSTSEQFDRVVLEALGTVDVPVLADVDFGHTEPRLTLPLGLPARLDTAGSTLTLEPVPPTTKEGT
ncbi:S66 peptidase family protein [Kitasatospora sp. NPDC093102]|uniref:S66 peptidase family protein n=1 Tax=Kitasatospora sp. NPDC093102 TaxID=3155069 RepID=UPI00343D871F